jgi:hypothetical protein
MKCNEKQSMKPERTMIEMKPEPWWLRLRVDLPAATVGRWAIEKQVIAEYQPIKPPRITIEAAGRPMPAVWPGTYTVLTERTVKRTTYTTEYLDSRDDDGRRSVAREQRVVWMSDSPNEIWEQIRAIRRLRGRVLIGGLGLGVMVKAALERADVTRVDVVELNQEIIDLVGPHYRDPRLTIHHANMMEWCPTSAARWDVAWFDIWPTISGANLPQMIELHSRYRLRARWVGSWADTWCVRSAAKQLPGVFDFSKLMRKALRPYGECDEDQANELVSMNLGEPETKG